MEAFLLSLARGRLDDLLSQRAAALALKEQALTWNDADLAHDAQASADRLQAHIDRASARLSAL